VQPTIKEGQLLLSQNLKYALIAATAIDFLIGLAFFFGPELNVNLWPTPITPVLRRFIGAIILGNSVGLLMVLSQGTWAGARALFAVALVYGALVLPALLYHLVLGDAQPVLWIYAIVDGIFLGPIAYVFFTNERAWRKLAK
jgi:hypothetical protein